jgi:hypothetical protein
MSAQQKRSILHLAFLLALAQHLILPSVFHANDLEREEKALKIISDFADKFCKDVPLKGRSDSIGLSGSAKADLKGILNKIVNLGFDGAAKYQDSEYEGLLQADLISALKDNMKCREQIWRDLSHKLLDRTDDALVPKSTLVAKSKPSDNKPSKAAKFQPLQSASGRVTVPHRGTLEVKVVDSAGVPQELYQVYVSARRDSPDKWVGNCRPGPTSKTFEIKDARILSVNASLCATKDRWILDKWHADRGAPFKQEQYKIIVNGVQIDPINEVEENENSANYVVNLKRE